MCEGGRDTVGPSARDKPFWMKGAVGYKTPGKMDALQGGGNRLRLASASCSSKFLLSVCMHMRHVIVNWRILASSIFYFIV